MRQRLGVNVDHVATLRQARRAAYPDPVAAAALAEVRRGQGRSPSTSARTAGTSRTGTSSSSGRPARRCSIWRWPPPRRW